MSILKKENADLAAALFSLLGEAIPHRRAFEEEAKRLIHQIRDREKILLKIIELCGEPKTPKHLYLIEKAYSWLGKKYYNETIKYAGEYLRTASWNELPNRIKVENGITVNYASAQRASVLVDLAKAQEGLGHLDAALLNFMEAYRLAPYSAMNAIKVADVIAKKHGREEALLFLKQQKESQYYVPVQYKDLQGNVRKNDLFKQLLDAHILKLQQST
ncbi:hypothetical protein FL966_04020 [Caproiciproducens galactitolivorans]|uniref:Uncharacterized protein n=1 Tax=Caproiciproducens galactitolivorans TaxID=642589 RepID=A0A4Z0YMS9_9FIRM|nr:hypothetical protein [Caproiciproducens galactitolivorans]QEY34286.1 hypothetical protein FL966_04020 [Caproiciproducens galactitolivorans]TGJ77952.1 hypothetical protein CAGA_03620 [Caproiciproducens galactitolivorans]